MVFKKISLNLKVFLILTLVIGGIFWLSGDGFVQATEVDPIKALEEKGGSSGTSIFSWVGSKVASGFMTVILSILYGVFRLVYLLLAGSMWLLDVVVSPEMFDAVFFSPQAIAGINTAWGFVRDFFNLFFILIVVLIGLSVILGVGKFKDKTMLIRVALSAMLINFSKPITLFFIDMSQVFTRYFALALGDNFTTKFLELLTFSKLLSGETLSDDLAYMVVIIFVIIMTIVIAVMLFYLAVSLIIRMIAFWVLIILSPFAFFGFAMEGTKLGSLKDGWIKDLISWCFYGPILLFFIWLALVLASTINGAMTEGIKNVPSLDPNAMNVAGHGGLGGFIVKVCGMLIPYITVIYLLFYGYDKAKSTSSGMATKILNAGNKKLSDWGDRSRRVATKPLRMGKEALDNRRKAIGAGIRESVDNSKLGKIFKSEEAKKKAQARREAKAKRDWGGDEGKALNELDRKDAYELQKKLKDDNTSEDDLRIMLNNKDKTKRMAASLLMAENNQIRSPEDFNKAMENLKGQDRLQGKVEKETKRENMSAVIGSKIGKLDRNDPNYNSNVQNIYKETIKNKNIQEIFKNQSKDFFLDQNGNIKPGALAYLEVESQGMGRPARRRMADHGKFKDQDVYKVLRNNTRGQYILGLR